MIILKITTKTKIYNSYLFYDSQNCFGKVTLKCVFFSSCNGENKIFFFYFHHITMPGRKNYKGFIVTTQNLIIILNYIYTCIISEYLLILNILCFFTVKHIMKGYSIFIYYKIWKCKFLDFFWATGYLRGDEYIKIW